MIKLTNAQASAFNSPVAMKLFSDQTRQFPFSDVFKLTDMIASIQRRHKTYEDTFRSIVAQYNGILTPEGRVVFEDPEDRVRGEKALSELNAVELEYPMNPVKPSPGWPSLTIVEATVLRPLLDVGDMTHAGYNSGTEGSPDTPSVDGEDVSPNTY